MAKIVTWKDVKPGSIMTEAGSASFRRTGDWRTERPVVDRELCNKCGMCWLHCPDVAIAPGEDGYYYHDYYYCKGCGICAELCPKGAITMVEEEEK